jgi:UDP-hydrolysing UDP-N-acetyl-D-glucosamine 2-epimerase
MVLGDRLEILAAASAALTLQIPIAHLHGGETAPAQWDEQIRHAVAKMSHIHFCATPNASRRLRQLGENPNSIYRVGAPALDYATRAAAEMRRSLPRILSPGDFRPLLILHPSSNDDAREFRRASMIITTLAKKFPDFPITAIGPNNDPGHRGILRAYKTHRKKIQLLMSVTQDFFWGLLHEHRLLVGNSSAGIIEAATFACAVINIGPRQSGRDRSGNVIDVDFSAAQISAAIKKALSDPAFKRRVASRKNIYGNGHAAQKIAATLKNLAKKWGPAGIPTIKQFADL